MKLPPYPEYKDSGVPWLGKIPVHWSLLRNKLLMEPKYVKVGDKQNDFVLLSLTLKGIIKRDVDNAKGKFPKDFDTYQSVAPGDFVFCLFDIDETPRTVGLSSLVGMVTGAYNVFANKTQNALYIYYYYLSIDTVKGLKPVYTGLRKVIQEDKFLQIKTPQPSSCEQNNIVEFLHWKTIQIAKFIRNKRRLIALLKEQKQNIINKAVTRGINPDVRLKPSGVDWIGDIPDHWEVKPVKRVFSQMFYGTSISSLDQEGCLVLGMGNIKDGEVTFNGCGHLKNISSDLILQPNDLLFNRTNSLGLVGKVGIFLGHESEQVTFASYLVCMRTAQGFSPEYMNYLLNCRSFLDFVRLHAIPSLHQANLNPTRYGRLSVPLPPYTEQIQILAKIKLSVMSIDSAITKAERHIQLMTEYRDRLIADVVTGKVDVRGVAVPDVVDEESPDLMDDEDIADVEAEDTLEEENEA